MMAGRNTDNFSSTVGILDEVGHVLGLHVLVQDCPGLFADLAFARQIPGSLHTSQTYYFPTQDCHRWTACCWRTKEVADNQLRDLSEHMIYDLEFSRVSFEWVVLIGG
jgi:hypothetical protein